MRYPFSELSGTVGSSVCWEDAFMAEWAAFQNGGELPRRFIWEERGR